MAQTDILIEMLERSMSMMLKALADFSDVDMLVRPVENANHALWMVGHVCVSEARMVSAVKPEMANIVPAAFAENFPQSKDRVNEVLKPMGKAEVITQYEKVRIQTVELVRSINDTELLRPIPSPFSKGSQTTVGFMLNMPVLHSTLHLGQIQVIRRKLGKPWIF